MKRTLSLLLAVLLCLCGCSANTIDTSAEEAALTELLTEIDTRMQPGTAGSSLVATYLAASLMDWSAETSLDEDKIFTIVEEVRNASAPNQPATFDQKMSAVDNAHLELMKDNGTQLLEVCGFDGELLPWSDASLASYEAVMSACGLR